MKREAKWIGKWVGFWILLITLSTYHLINSHLAQACVVCFGGADSQLKKGFYWGIIILLALPFLLIGLIGGKIYLSAKKQRTLLSHQPRPNL
ncbi:MAG: hypothetical protein HY399_07985 [Elusimicrobia bacterium]|nr:hypothetical protein [Elusimicrobiota bacterium]